MTIKRPAISYGWATDRASDLMKGLERLQDYVGVEWFGGPRPIAAGLNMAVKPFIVANVKGLKNG